MLPHNTIAFTQEIYRMATEAVKHPFLTDIQTLRARARMHIEQGAITEGYKADREVIVNLLNEALATEIVCILRYKRHYFMASGINASPSRKSFCSMPPKNKATRM